MADLTETNNDVCMTSNNHHFKSNCKPLLVSDGRKPSRMHTMYGSIS